MQLGSLSDGVGGGLSVPAARLWVSEPRTASPCQTGLQPGAGWGRRGTPWTPASRVFPGRQIPQWAVSVLKRKYTFSVVNPSPPPSLAEVAAGFVSIVAVHRLTVGTRQEPRADRRFRRANAHAGGTATHTPGRRGPACHPWAPGPHARY